MDFKTLLAEYEATTPTRLSSKSALIRTALLLVALALCVWLLAAHGVRGFAVVAALVLLTALPQTRGYRLVDRWLVRLTGSRRSALVLLTAIAVASIVGVGVLQLLR